VNAAPAAGATALASAVVVPMCRRGGAMTKPPDEGEATARRREWRPMLPPELFSPAISPDAVKVYGALCLNANGTTGECWPSQATIAARIGVSRRRVSAAIAVLIAHGFVELVRDHGFMGSRRYRLPHQVRPPLNVPDRRNHQALNVPNRRIGMCQNGTSECAESAHEPDVSEPDVREPPPPTASAEGVAAAVGACPYETTIGPRLWAAIVRDLGAISPALSPSWLRRALNQAPAGLDAGRLLEGLNRFYERVAEKAAQDGTTPEIHRIRRWDGFARVRLLEALAEVAEEGRA
jgi:DNA-binding transcriptional MocR family regulator